PERLPTERHRHPPTDRSTRLRAAGAVRETRHPQHGRRPAQPLRARPTRHALRRLRQPLRADDPPLTARSHPMPRMRATQAHTETSRHRMEHTMTDTNGAAFAAWFEQKLNPEHTTGTADPAP